MASSPQQGQGGGGAVCPAEQFWSLLDKADRRTSDTALLSEAFVFYHAVLDCGYFHDEHLGASTKHLRFLAKFLLVALILSRRAQTVPRLAFQIRALWLAALKRRITTGAGWDPGSSPPPLPTGAGILTSSTTNGRRLLGSSSAPPPAACTSTPTRLPHLASGYPSSPFQDMDEDDTTSAAATAAKATENANSLKRKSDDIGWECGELVDPNNT